MEQLELKLTPEEYDALVFAYVRHALRAESRNQFEATYNQTRDIKEALWHGVINEMVNVALLETLKSHTAATAQPTEE